MNIFQMSSARDGPGINQLAPTTTMAEFLSTFYENSYVEGESIVSDFLMTLVRTFDELVSPISLIHHQHFYV